MIVSRDETSLSNNSWYFKIDCEIQQKGFRIGLLRDFLHNKTRLQINKSLRFFIDNIDIIDERLKMVLKENIHIKG